MTEKQKLKRNYNSVGYWSFLNRCKMWFLDFFGLNVPFINRYYLKALSSFNYFFFIMTLRRQKNLLFHLHAGLERIWPSISNCAHPDVSSSWHICWSLRHLQLRQTLRQKCKSRPGHLSSQTLHGAPAPTSCPSLEHFNFSRLSSNFDSHSGAAGVSTQEFLLFIVVCNANLSPIGGHQLLLNNSNDSIRLQSYCEKN